ncbi:unnamed protein product [Schistocephalus solidus]|uniref:Guanylate cyclase domain-containing protein n=1 Tax=Schistocephalus solidus TaxID=70667 RepID=A0A183SER2_SCHSO|nr:unnamed protein product [Schistocephalus solidus]
MSRSDRAGLAAGDSEVPPPIVLEHPIPEDVSLLLNDDHNTISEPRGRPQSPSRGSESLVHRHSTPAVWGSNFTVSNVIGGRDIPSSTTSGVRAAVEVPSYNVNNQSEICSEDNTEAEILLQKNNNRPIEPQKESKKTLRVKFALDSRASPDCRSPSRESRARTPSNSGNRQPNFEGIAVSNENFPDLASLNSSFCNQEKCDDLKSFVSKGIAYRRARIICISGSVLAILFAILEACFLFASLALRVKCRDIAGFLGKVSLLFLIAVILEWFRCCIWREVTHTASNSHLPTQEETNLMHTSALHHLDKEDSNALGLQRSVNSLSDFRADTALGELIQTRSFASTTGPLRRFSLDGKQVAVSFILFIIYFILLGLLLDGAFWIPLENNSSVRQGQANHNKTFNEATPVTECPSSGFRTGLCFLVMHCLLLGVRITFCCVSGFGGAVRFIISRFRKSSRQSLSELIVERNLPVFPGKMEQANAGETADK